MKKILCDIYRSKNKSDCYIYVCQKDGLEKVPEDLMDQFKDPEKFMTLVLTPEKKLARADVIKVIKQLEDQGFYLQLPPLPYGAAASD